MIKIENVEIQGFDPAIRGLRNPMNSWDKADSHRETCCNGLNGFYIGEKDKDLAKRMNATVSESKYRRMIVVWCDVVAPFYWWKEYDTYKVGTVANSCSTMHKIHAKEFVLSDFSTDHLSRQSVERFNWIVEYLNKMREAFISTKNKDYWWQMIQFLPESYNQRRTLMLNYEVLAKQYRERKNHKLDEWKDYCKWIRSLPYSELITGENNED